jgi:hypothetical protein
MRLLSTKLTLISRPITRIFSPARGELNAVHSCIISPLPLLGQRAFRLIYIILTRDLICSLKITILTSSFGFGRGAKGLRMTTEAEELLCQSEISA